MFLQRIKVEGVRWLSSTDSVEDKLIRLGTGQNRTPILTVRLVEVRLERPGTVLLLRRSIWKSYLLFVVADLCRRRWHIEDAFIILKRVLNLAIL